MPEKFLRPLASHHPNFRQKCNDFLEVKKKAEELT
jgi:hypothetical protein